MGDAPLYFTLQTLLYAPFPGTSHASRAPITVWKCMEVEGSQVLNLGFGYLVQIWVQGFGVRIGFRVSGFGFQI